MAPQNPLHGPEQLVPDDDNLEYAKLEHNGASVPPNTARAEILYALIIEQTSTSINVTRRRLRHPFIFVMKVVVAT